MSADALLAPIRDHITGLGFELVDLRRTGTFQRPILQVRVDRPDSRPGQGVTADDCAAISRSLERFLESRAMVGPRYVLEEMSSPGFGQSAALAGALAAFRRAARPGFGAGTPPDVVVASLLPCPTDRPLGVRRMG